MTKFEYTDWIKHDGLGIPVLSGTFVLVRLQDDREDEIETPEQFEEDMKLSNEFGLHDTYVAKYWGPHWHSTHANPIIAYRVITPLT